MIERTPVKHVVLTSLGDMLGGFKGALVNAAVRHVKKMVPPLLPQAVRFRHALEHGRHMTLLEPTQALKIWLCCNTPVAIHWGQERAMLLHRNIIANLLQSEAWNHPL